MTMWCPWGILVEAVIPGWRACIVFRVVYAHLSSCHTQNLFCLFMNYKSRGVQTIIWRGHIVLVAIFICTRSWACFNFPYDGAAGQSILAHPCEETQNKRTTEKPKRWQLSPCHSCQMCGKGRRASRGQRASL